MLAVKQLKDGKRQICLAYCIADFIYDNPLTGERERGPRGVCGGNNNITHWMALPEIPEVCKT